MDLPDQCWAPKPEAMIMTEFSLNAVVLGVKTRLPERSLGGVSVSLVSLLETGVVDSQRGDERNAKRKNDGTVGKAMLADHESKADRPVGTVTNNDLQSRPLGTHPRWSGK